MQQTKFNKLIVQLLDYFAISITGPWKRRSLGLISLLLGFYLGSNITVYFLERIGQRPFVVFSLFIIIEIITRIRSNVKAIIWPLHWLAIDNIRIGLIYSIVLEAFKLGS